MTITRRDLIQFVGGSALGTLFTPAPWRLITDTALWSENWPGIPRPARGEIRAKFTNCSLCNAGCAVRARCVGDRPVSLAGVGGGLCPFGLTAHHLPFHPARPKQSDGKDAIAAVTAAIAGRRPSEHVVVLDSRPGRTASWTYRRAMAALPGGLYVSPPEPPVAIDLRSARTVLSLSAPLLDGWGTPAKVFAARDGFRLIQAEAVESRTAALADVWLPIRPGTEEALAMSIAGELSAAEAARITGLAEHLVASLPQELQKNGPALVIDAGMSPGVVELNRRLGAWGRTVFPRPEAPVPESWRKAAPPTELAAVSDGSVRVLWIDESAPGQYFPWEAIERKLAANALVAVFTSWMGGYARRAPFVLPTAVYPERLDDVPMAIDSAAATFRIAAPLVSPPPGVINPEEFIAALAGVAASDALRQRAAAIHKRGRGTLLTYADGKSVPVRDVKSEDFWKALNAGGRWEDDVAQALEPAARRPFPALSPQAAKIDDYPLTIITESRLAGLASPSLSQIYQESNVRLAANRVALHPADASSCGVVDGAHAVLESQRGKREVTVTVDASVRPGVVLVAGLAEIGAASAKVVRL